MNRFARTFNWVAAVSVLSTVAVAYADAVKFTAEPDRTQIGQDESVSIKFSVEQEGSPGSVSEPELTAPDFDQLTSYQSSYVQSYYENGKFGMRSTQAVTVVLRPKKAGSLTIGGIQTHVGGKVYAAAPITVQVTAGGAGTQPPQGYGGNVGLRGAGKTHDTRSFFIRAEVNKQKLYKGEQVIVSYYLYSKVRVLNMEVKKFPTLDGFLKEELELPVATNQFTSQPVVLDGVAYDRKLLARYAAYPLQEGKMRIDPMEIDANYYGHASMPGMDDDDPFSQFFRRLAPQHSDQRSEPVDLEVLPIPTEGRPADFAGTVGKFEVKSAIDKTEVKAGQPVTLTVMVQGRGNLSSIKEPKPNWPAGVDPYESKGRTQSGAGGEGERIFEFLLIPRKAGEVTLPVIEFPVFNPEKKEFEVLKTTPVRVQVLPGEEGEVAPPPVQTTAVQPAVVAPQMGGLLEPGSVLASPRSRSVLKIISSLAVALVFLLFLGSLWLEHRKKHVRRERSSNERLQDALAELETLKKEAESAPEFSTLSRFYFGLENMVFSVLQERYGVPARSLPRAEIRRELESQPSWKTENWARADRFLTTSEHVRFAGTDPAFQNSARAEMAQLLTELRLWIDALSSRDPAITP